MRHLLLDELLGEALDPDVETVRRDDPPALDRIVLAVRQQRDERHVALELGVVERGGPAQRLERLLPRGLQTVAQRQQLLPRRRPVEPADTDVHRVDRPAADDAQQLVARLLHVQTALDDAAMVAGHLDRAVVPEEVGRVQHVDVQRVALDPLAAVQEPAQQPDRLGNRHAAGVLHRRDRAHLVGDRADPADACRDVGRLGERAAAQQPLEEARRLVDPQRHVGHPPVADRHAHRALAFDARERVDGDRARAARRTAVVGPGCRLVSHRGPRRRCGTGRLPR